MENEYSTCPNSSHGKQFVVRGMERFVQQHRLLQVEPGLGTPGTCKYEVTQHLPFFVSLVRLCGVWVSTLLAQLVLEARRGPAIAFNDLDVSEREGVKITDNHFAAWTPSDLIILDFAE